MPRWGGKEAQKGLVNDRMMVAEGMEGREGTECSKSKGSDRKSGNCCSHIATLALCLSLLVLLLMH